MYLPFICVSLRLKKFGNEFANEISFPFFFFFGANKMNKKIIPAIIGTLFIGAGYQYYTASTTNSQAAQNKTAQATSPYNTLDTTVQKGQPEDVVGTMKTKQARTIVADNAVSTTVPRSSKNSSNANGANAALTPMKTSDNKGGKVHTMGENDAPNSAIDNNDTNLNSNNSGSSGGNAGGGHANNGNGIQNNDKDNNENAYDGNAASDVSDNNAKPHRRRRLSIGFEAISETSPYAYEEIGINAGGGTGIVITNPDKNPNLPLPVPQPAPAPNSIGSDSTGTPIASAPTPNPEPAPTSNPAPNIIPPASRPAAPIASIPAASAPVPAPIPTPNPNTGGGVGNDSGKQIVEPQPTPSPNSPIASEPKPTPAPIASEPKPKPTPTPIASEPKPKPTPAPIASEPKPKPAPAPIASEPKPAPNIPIGKNVKTMAEAVAAAAENNQIKTITINDGVNSVTFQKGGAGNFTSADLAGWTANLTTAVPIVIFQTENNSDITNSLERAIAYVQKNNLNLPITLPQEMKATLRKQINLPANTKLHGNHSQVIPQVGGAFPNRAALFLNNGSDNVEIQDIYIDMQHMTGMYGILGYTVKNVTIRGNRFTHVHSVNKNEPAAAIQFYSGETGHITNIVVENNFVQADFGTAKTHGQTEGISFNGAMLVNNAYTTAKSRLWQEMSELGAIEPIDPNRTIKNIAIKGNVVDGAYYGISFNSVSDSVISGNHVTNNTRNISLQNHSNNNLIENNLLTDSISTSVHIAYQSNNNIVRRNTSSTERGTGQALMQAYQRSIGNIFHNNRIDTVSNANMHAMYAATGSDGTQFRDNIITGRQSKAVISVESIWDTKSAGAERSAYAYGKDGDDPEVSDNHVSYKGGHGTMSDITIQGNILAPQITRYDAPMIAPVVYLCAYTSVGLKNDRKIIGSLNNVKIGGNVWLVLPQIRPTTVHERVRQHISTTDARLALPTITGTGITDDANSGVIKLASTVYQQGTERYSIADYTMAAGETRLELLGGSLFNYYGTISNQSNINGTGNSEDNIIIGNSQENVLNGGAGNDRLDGGVGNDTLIGGSGADTFVFSSKIQMRENRDEKLGGKHLEYRSFLDNNNLDTIEDFNAAEGDKIGLSRVLFGRLDGDWLAYSPETAKYNTRIIYQNNTLYYDADGNGTVYQPVAFAKLKGNQPITLTTDNFTLIEVADSTGSRNNYQTGELPQGVTENKTGATETAATEKNAVLAAAKNTGSVPADAGIKAGKATARALADDGQVAINNVDKNNVMAITNDGNGARTESAATAAAPEEAKTTTAKMMSILSPVSKQRGLILDVAHQFHSIDSLKGFIDDTAKAGGGFIYLNLSNNENYVLESRLLGQTTATAQRYADGSYMNPTTGKPFYSVAQIKELSAYAANKGIELIPEISAPTHMGGIVRLLQAQKSDWLNTAFTQNNELNYSNAQGMGFIKKLYDEAEGVFSNLKHLHIGAGELSDSISDNDRFIAYANHLILYYSGKGITLRIWNDGVLKTGLGKLDKRVEIVYRNLNENSVSRDKELYAKYRATVPELLKSEYKVIELQSILSASKHQ